MDAGDRALIGPLPADPALPGLAQLEPVHLARTLARHASGATVADARVRHLDWTPGRRFAAHVDALVHPPDAPAGTRRDAVVHGTTDPDAPGGVRWLPDDPDLPLLRVGWARTSTRLAYRPGTRVALEVGDRVVTGYSSVHAFERARDGLETLSTALGPAAAKPDKPLPHLLATAYRAVAGAPPTPDETADPVLFRATAAGAALARLHRSGVRAQRATTAGATVALTEHAIRVVEAALPEEGRRARDVADRLRRCLPEDDDVVVAHGAYTPDHVVRGGGPGQAEVVVLARGAVASAPRALDVVAYPASVVQGGPADAQRADEVLDAFLDGYGIGPKHLDWHLAAAVLRRCAVPVHRLARDWPAQVAGLLDVAQEVSRRCAALRV